MGEGKKEFLYGDLTYKIRKVLFAVHNELGMFAREKQYCDLAEQKFEEEQDLFCEREVTVSDSNNRLDFVIARKVVLEFKSKPFLTKEDYFQMQRYLQTTNLRLGILVNFRSKYLVPKRVLNSKSNL